MISVRNHIFSSKLKPFFFIYHVHSRVHFFGGYSSFYSDRTAQTQPKAYCIPPGWGKCSISHGRNPLARKRRDNCWLAFASTGGTGWLAPIMGELRLPCCASRHYNWHWERNRFSKSLSAPCIIHTYAQKNTSVPLHTLSHTLSCSEAYVPGAVKCMLIQTRTYTRAYARRQTYIKPNHQRKWQLQQNWNPRMLSFGKKTCWKHQTYPQFFFF